MVRTKRKRAAVGAAPDSTAQYSTVARTWIGRCQCRVVSPQFTVKSVFLVCRGRSSSFSSAIPIANAGFFPAIITHYKRAPLSNLIQHFMMASQHPFRMSLMGFLLRAASAHWRVSRNMGKAACPDTKRCALLKE
jgi:hypothetical protein